ncbi:glycine C-acetyltransferase [Nocardiopsis sp. SBT366]|uniref:glycine C-acetyltransferase n=1 Tax=Nocardiopsis sp. SBT366 TaxID=1580529 RepID=UPI000ACBE57B|nr:glycine C-acetyltransferase [Nocardiopsis sp. SBT366]
MYSAMRDHLKSEIEGIREAGLFKDQRLISGPQSARISVGDDSVLNFCSNNYLGLADHPDLIDAAKRTLDESGFGMASVRFICGTQDLHARLERRLSEFLRVEDTILYSSCFDANAGVFETLLTAEDAVISDELNHASIIDGIRLSKAGRYRYKNRDMADLEKQLVAAANARHRLIVTDGVFSMDGYLAPLDEICDLAERYDALVMVDDSHAVGFVGPNGQGTPELFGVQDRVDIVTGTLGKALGGASGGYVAGHAEIVEILRQRSRPYLFSNSLAPMIVGASLRVLDMLSEADDLRTRLNRNAALFRESITAAGFDVLDGEHAIVPVMIGDAAEAARMASALLEKGVYVTAFSYPVVPMGRARIRVQLSAAHSEDDVRAAVAAFAQVRDELGDSGTTD